MPPPAWIALILLMGVGLIVAAFLLHRLVVRPRERSVPPTADGETPQHVPSNLSVGLSSRLEVDPVSPASSEDDLLQPGAGPQRPDAEVASPSCDQPTGKFVETATIAASSVLPATDAPEPPDGRVAATAARADAPPQVAADPGLKDNDGNPHSNLPDDHGTMRITKRSSGGRGEYEISETFGRMTPRDLLGHVLVLDLGEGLQIPTGVVLLDRNGKRRLRIDPSSGAEIHLHRQLAAALLMPYPARGETAWGAGEPIMESDRYGIGTIELSRVELGDGTVVVVPDRVEIANSDRQAQVDCTQRLQQLRLLWSRRASLPSGVAALLDQHERETARRMPLGPRTETIVADLQRAAAAHAQTMGLESSQTADAVPFLLSLLEGQGQTASAQVAALPAPAAADSTQTPAPEPAQIPAPVQQTEPACQPAPTAAAVARDTSKPAEPAPVPPLPEPESIEETAGEEPSEPIPEEEPEPKPPPVPQPRRYQPQARGAAAARKSRTVKPRQETAERSCPIEVRLRSRTGGSFTVSLLPRRRNGMPEEVEVSGAGESPLTLSAFHEAWYQDVVTADAGTVLTRGAAWYADLPEGRLQWMLSGRDLYVLGPRDELSGFVSAPRLVLGDQHTVLCTAEQRSQVLQLLKNCCGTEPDNIGPEDGLPEGWVGFRGVCPIHPLPASSSPDILDALRPAPDVQINLRGGIRLQHSQWLAGFPPAIRLTGVAADAPLAVTIDGHAAARGADGNFTAPGWDRQGEHLVACDALTRSYSLVEPPESWEPWSAHQSGRLAICGAATGVVSHAAINSSVVVPATNPLLLGQHPGQVYLCPVRPDIGTGFCAGAPPFRPVWAVPASPLRVDKSTARILWLDWPAPLEASEQAGTSGASIRMWVQAILDCGRKGLRLAEETPEATAVWRACRDQARSIWRKRR